MHMLTLQPQTLPAGVFFCTIALATWYGSLKVADGTYTGARAVLPLRCNCRTAAVQPGDDVRSECVQRCTLNTCRHVPSWPSTAGGEVLSILMASMLGGFALGQVGWWGGGARAVPACPAGFPTCPACSASRCAASEVAQLCRCPQTMPHLKHFSVGIVSAEQVRPWRCKPGRIVVAADEGC